MFKKLPVALVALALSSLAGAADATTRYMNVDYTHPVTGNASHEAVGDSTASTLDSTAIAAFAYPVSDLTLTAEVPAAGDYAADTTYFPPGGPSEAGQQNILFTVGTDDRFTISASGAQPRGVPISLDISRTDELPDGTYVDVQIRDVNSGSVVGRYYLMVDKKAPVFDSDAFTLPSGVGYLSQDPEFDLAIIADAGEFFAGNGGLLPEGVVTDENGLKITRLYTRAYKGSRVLDSNSVHAASFQSKGVAGVHGNYQTFNDQSASSLGAQNIGFSYVHFQFGFSYDEYDGSSDFPYFQTWAYTVRDPAGNQAYFVIAISSSHNCYNSVTRKYSNYLGENVAYRDPAVAGSGYTTATMEAGADYSDFSPYPSGEQLVFSDAVDILYRVPKAHSATFDLTGLSTYASGSYTPMPADSFDDDYAYYILSGIGVPYVESATRMDTFFGNGCNAHPHEFVLDESAQASSVKLDYLGQLHAAGHYRQVGNFYRETNNDYTGFSNHEPIVPIDTLPGVEYDGGSILIEARSSSESVTIKYGLNTTTTFDVDVVGGDTGNIHYCTIPAGDQYCEASHAVTSFATVDTNSPKISITAAEGNTVDTGLYAHIARAKTRYYTVHYPDGSTGNESSPEYDNIPPTADAITTQTSIFGLGSFLVQDNERRAYGYEVTFTHESGSPSLTLVEYTNDDNSKTATFNPDVGDRRITKEEFFDGHPVGLYTAEFVLWDLAGNSTVYIPEDGKFSEFYGDLRSPLVYTDPDGNTHTTPDANPGEQADLAVNGVTAGSIEELVEAVRPVEYKDQVENYPEYYNVELQLSYNAGSSQTRDTLLFVDQEIGDQDPNDQFFYVENITSEVGQEEMKSQIIAVLESQTAHVNIFGSDVTFTYTISTQPDDNSDSELVINGSFQAPRHDILLPDEFIELPNSVFVPHDENQQPAFNVDLAAYDVEIPTGQQTITVESLDDSIPLLFDGNLLSPLSSVSFTYDFDATPGKLILPISVANDGDEGQPSFRVNMQTVEFDARANTWTVAPETNPSPIEIVGGGNDFTIELLNTDGAGCALRAEATPPATLDMTSTPECYVVWGNMSEGLTASDTGTPSISGRAIGVQTYTADYSIYLKDQFGASKVAYADTISFTTSPPPTVQPTFDDGDNIIRVPNVPFVPLDAVGDPEFHIEHRDGEGNLPTGEQQLQVSNEAGGIAVEVDGLVINPGETVYVPIDYGSTSGYTSVPFKVATAGDGVANLTVLTQDSNATNYEVQLETWGVETSISPDPLEFVGDNEDFEITFANESASEGTCTMASGDPSFSTNMIALPVCTLVVTDIVGRLTPNASGQALITGRATGQETMSFTYSIYAKDQHGQEVLLETDSVSFNTIPSGPIAPVFADGDNLVVVPNANFVPRDADGNPEFNVEHYEGSSLATGVQNIQIETGLGSVPLNILGSDIQPATPVTISYDFDANNGLLTLPITAPIGGTDGTATLTVTTVDSQNIEYTATVETWTVATNTNPDPIEVQGDGQEFTITIEDQGATNCPLTTTTAASASLDMVSSPECYINWDAHVGVVVSDDGPPVITGRTYGGEDFEVDYSVRFRDQHGNESIVSTHELRFSSPPPAPIAVTFADGDNIIAVPFADFVPFDTSGNPEFNVEHYLGPDRASGVQNLEISTSPESIALNVAGQPLAPGATITISVDFDATQGRILLPVKATTDAGAADLSVVTVDSGVVTYTAVVETWAVAPSTLPDPLNIQGDGLPFQFNVTDTLNSCRLTSDAVAGSSLDMIAEPVCTLVWDSHENLTASDAGVPTISGRSFGANDFSVDYSLYLQDQHGQTVFISSHNVVFSATDDMPDIQPQGLKDSYEAFLESVKISFNGTNETFCTEYLSSQQSAIENHLDSVRTYCYVDFIQIPSGLSDPESPLTAELTGVLDQIGIQTVEFKIFVYEEDGTEHEVQHINRDIEGVEPDPPVLQAQQLSTSEDGSKLLIPHTSGTYGRIRVQGIGPEVVIEIDDGEIQTSQVLEEGRVRPGLDHVEVLRADRQPLWRSGTINITAYYSINPTNKTTLEFDYLVVPDNSLRAVQSTAESTILDTQLYERDLYITDDTGLIEFNNGDTGTWNSRLAIRAGYRQFSNVTEPKELDISALQSCSTPHSGCLATSEIHDVTTADLKGYNNMSLYSIVDIQSPDASIEKQLISNPIYVSVLKGGPIEASVVTRRTFGIAPYRTLIAVDFEDYQSQIATGSIVWEVREAEGEWETAEAIRPTQLIYSFPRGVHEVRAKLTNKFDETVSYTDILQVVAYPAIRLTVEGGRNSLIGSEETLTAVITGRSPTDVINVEDFHIDWSYDNGATYTTSGPTATVTSPVQGRVMMKVRARSKLIPDEVTSSYVYKTWPVTFNPPKPGRGAIYGPASIEYGSTYTFNAVDISPYRYMSLEMKGEWVLPDGSTVVGDELEYTPSDAERDAGKAIITRKVYYTGYEEHAGLGQKSVRVTEYIFPEFAIYTLARPSIAPTDVTLSVRPIGYSGIFRNGEYTWQVPEEWELISQNTLGTAKYRAPFAGTRTVLLRVTDDRGNVANSSEQITLGQAEPYSLDIRVSKSNIYDRAPLKVALRPRIDGGHPYDRVQEYKYRLNGEELASSNGVAYATLDEGLYAVELGIETKYGAEPDSAILNIEVKANQPPTCTFTDFDRRSYSRIEVRAACDDPDGRITKYEWTVNGEVYGINSYRLLANGDEDIDYYSVQLQTTDDGGLVTTFYHDVNYGPPPAL